jgi:transketolase
VSQAAAGKAMRDVWGEKLVELGAADPRTVVLDGDLANSTKADKFANAHPDRFFQMGIAEQNLIGAAAGLASVGFVPWTSSFTVFFTHRALDPVRMLVAQSHANVKIVASYSGLLIGAVGKTHLDVQDLAIMRAMPDMTVLVPGDATELLGMMDWAQAHDGPVYLRLVRDAVPDLVGPDYRFEPGAVHTLRSAGAGAADVAFVSTGPQTGRVLEAAEQLAESGVSASVIHVPSLKPIDAEGLIAALGDPGLVVTVEEHTISGGLGGLVAEVVTAAGPTPHRIPPIERIGLDDTWGESAGNAFLLEKHGLSAARIADRVAQLVPARSTR